MITTIMVTDVMVQKLNFGAIQVSESLIFGLFLCRKVFAGDSQVQCKAPGEAVGGRSH